MAGALEEVLVGEGRRSSLKSMLNLKGFQDPRGDVHLIPGCRNSQLQGGVWTDAGVGSRELRVGCAHPFDVWSPREKTEEER